MDNLSFNDLPQAISRLYEEVVTIKQLLLIKGKEGNSESNRWFNLQELRDYLPDKPSKNTIYSWVQKKSIPYHKGAKKLRFLKSEIDDWMANDRNPISGPCITPESFLKKKEVRRV